MIAGMMTATADGRSDVFMMLEIRKSPQGLLQAEWFEKSQVGSGTTEAVRYLYIANPLGKSWSWSGGPEAGVTCHAHRRH